MINHYFNKIIVSYKNRSTCVLGQKVEENAKDFEIGFGRLLLLSKYY